MDGWGLGALMLSTLKRLTLPDTSLHCPRCEKSMTNHDEAACARRISRRYFFGVVVGAVIAAPKGPTGGLLDPVADLADEYRSSSFRSALCLNQEGWTSLSTAVLNKGDVITVASVYRVNQPTRFRVTEVIEPGSDFTALLVG